jgi:hypothetical protein
MPPTANQPLLHRSQRRAASARVLRQGEAEAASAPLAAEQVPPAELQPVRGSASEQHPQAAARASVAVPPTPWRSHGRTAAASASTRDPWLNPCRQAGYHTIVIV